MTDAAPPVTPGTRTTSAPDTGLPRRYDANLVFVGGFPSGGTDLTMSVLNAHPEVFIPPGFAFLPKLGDTFGPSVPADQLEHLVSAFRKVDSLDSFRTNHWHNFTTNRRDEIELGPPPEPEDGVYSLSTIYQWMLGVPEHVTWTGNKWPNNTENLDRLHRVFPKARYIIVTRDIRDTVISAEKKWGKDHLMFAAKYERRMSIHLDLLKQVDVPVHRLRFENLLDDLEGEARRICEFLELEFDPKMLEFHKHLTKVMHGKPNWGKPLIPRNYEKWRKQLSPERIKRVEEIAYTAMTALDYPPEYAEGPRAITLRERVVGRLADIKSTLFVHNRHAINHPRRRQVYLKSLELNVRKFTTHRSIRR
jgi:hypothetical protein